MADLEALIHETLSQKHRRLMQAKCTHDEIYESTVASADGTFTTRFCLDCGADLKARATR